MNVDLFLETLPYMAKGMLGIFTVTFVIMLGISVFGKISEKISFKNENQKTDEDEK